MANKPESLLENLTQEDLARIIAVVNSGELSEDQGVQQIRRSFIEDEAACAEIRDSSGRMPCCSGPVAIFAGRSATRRRIG